MTRITVNGILASELDWIHETCEIGDEDYDLGVQWDGKAIVIFDSEHAMKLACIAAHLGNGWDNDIRAGMKERCAELKREACLIRDGFWRLSERLVKHA